MYIEKSGEHNPELSTEQRTWENLKGTQYSEHERKKHHHQLLHN